MFVDFEIGHFYQKKNYEIDCKFFIRMANQNKEEYFNALVDKVQVKANNDKIYELKPPAMDYKKVKGMRGGIFLG